MSTGAIAEWFNLSLASQWDDLLSQQSCDLNGSMREHLTGGIAGKPYSQRLDAFADAFEACLPEVSFAKRCKILQKCFGPENPKDTGMFSNFYWLLPVSRFIQRHGATHPTQALSTIGELTKRSTGEYAIRPIAAHHPELALEQCRKWAASSNFHQRRLASEGIRPRLPWAAKLEVYLDDPTPVLEILESLLDDPSIYVRKSVANHASDYFRLEHHHACHDINKWRSTHPDGSADVFRRLDKRIGRK